MSYRDQDDELSKDARMERLENAVAKVSVRRVYQTLKWGIQSLFLGGGIGLVLFGGSFMVQRCGANDAAHHQYVLEEQEADLREQQERQEMAEAPRFNARQECEEACTNVGMGIQRCRVVEDGDEHFRPASCSCASSDGATRILWNDLISREQVLRRQCAEACGEANLGMQRALFQDGEMVACGCVSPHVHRTLWDDRQPPTCTLESHGDNASCELEGWSP